MSQPKPIQLGLCCQNMTLKQKSIYSSRKIIMRIIHERGIQELKRRVLLNLQDLLSMIQWNEQMGIRVFRLSSELFPHKTNPKVESYSFEFAIPLLQSIGTLAKRYGHRLTFHPGQYNVLASPNTKYYLQTIKDLQYHADVLDLMGMNQDSVLVIHGGGVYQNKSATIQRWCERYKRLPDSIRSRLVLENCEKNFSIVDCLNINLETGVPIVFDCHHFNCYNLYHPGEIIEPASYFIPLILDTWYQQGIKPKFHVSEQGSGRIGHHSDYVKTIPDYLLSIPETYGIDIDIMIEAKMKELSIQKLYQTYPHLNCQLK